MLKNILNLDGAQELTRNEQKSINGGRRKCGWPNACPNGVPCCDDGYCKDIINENSCFLP
jgi:hypothetical protein